MKEDGIKDRRSDITITDLDSLRAVMIGRQIGEYKITEEVGRGGMGIVYMGIHTFLEQDVAIKMLNPAMTLDPQIKERFLNEAKIQCKLSHPNITTIHNFLQFESYYCIVMEYIPGKLIKIKDVSKRERNLSQAIVIRGPQTLVEIKNTVLQILKALTYAHSKNIIHRDIKPSNILFTELGIPKLSDFGIAKIIGGEKTKTTTGQAIGTAWYISPEQVMGKLVDARSDIYSLGITLYEMATGKVPFDGDTDFAIYKAHLEKRPKNPRDLNPNIAKELESIILKCIAKEPANRYASAQDLYRAVESLQFGKANASIPTPKNKQAKKIIITRKKLFNPVPYLLPIFFIIAIITAYLLLKNVVRLPFLVQKPSKNFTMVPDLRGMQADQAADTLKTLRLHLQAIKENETNKYKAGVICNQEENPGDTLAVGDTVKVYLSKEMIKFCSNCHAPVTLDQKFCTKCNTRIRE